MGLGDWLRDRAEIKAAERKAFQKAKVKAHAETQRKAIEAATASGEERAYSGRKLPKPNPEKIAAIKSGLSKMADRADTAGERMKAGEMDNFSGATPQRKPNGRKSPVRKSPVKRWRRVLPSFLICSVKRERKPRPCVSKKRSPTTTRLK